ncbi:hypothetical protein [Streptomyces sp. SID4985]|uniref:hypothetical protein n=1 Tax=unclassified Streptomyces TaxID=2593676 RepID=UPI00136D45B5|nr:hypothetical protein [Streptomyces sp. SID4985]MYQ47987.1 hypothetical protein [Streptomyces sp. SID4985]
MRSLVRAVPAAGALINAVPRPAGASESVLFAATAAGGLATLTGIALAALTGRRTRGVSA